MNINNNTPDIRFNGFIDDWIEGKVRDVLKIKSGMVIPPINKNA